MHTTNHKQRDNAVIEQAKAAYEKSPVSSPMVNPFVNIFEGWDWRRKFGFHDATMHENLIDAATDALEPHYRCTAMFDLKTGAVTMLNLSLYADQLDQERQNDTDQERQYERGATLNLNQVV